MKTRTTLSNLEDSKLLELSDEQLLQVHGSGTTIHWSSSQPSSGTWSNIDMDGATYDDDGGASQGGGGHYQM